MCRMKIWDNKCCVFFFMYRGKIYDLCVLIRVNFRWCFLFFSYDKDRKYGYCKGKI